MMKKLKFRLLTIGSALLIVLLLVLILPKKRSESGRSTVHLAAEVFDDHTLKGSMRLHYVNTEPFSVDQLTFCLYPNAYREAENVSTKENFEAFYPHGFSEGRMMVYQVLVNGKKAAYTLEDAEQFLIVALKEELKPGESTEVAVTFKDVLADCRGRFGCGIHTQQYSTWYPVLCPFNEGEAVKNRHTPFGDPFCFESADYEAEIVAPKNLRLAVGGKIITGETLGNKQKWVVKANDARDFSFVLSSDYQLKSRKTGQTMVYVYSWETEETAEMMLEIAVSALEKISELFGPYPYETFTVAEADFYKSGMEYAGLALISENVMGSPESIRQTIVHETAHQWFYGIAGSDQSREPWLDEGLAQYAMALYEKTTGGEKAYRSFIQSTENRVKLRLALQNAEKTGNSTAILRPISDFSGETAYETFCYDVPVLMLDSLRGFIGREDLLKGLKNYLEKNKDKIASTKDFLSAMNEASDRDVSTLLLPWLYGNVSL